MRYTIESKSGWFTGVSVNRIRDNETGDTSVSYPFREDAEWDAECLNSGAAILRDGRVVETENG